MVSLVDLGPASKEVPIRGKSVTVRGITAQDIFGLLNDYPELRYVITGRKPKTEGELITTLIEGIPGSLGRIIASACGESDDPKAVGAAQTLTIGEKLLVLEAAIDLTFPQGVSSFAASLAKLASQAGAPGWGADTNSRAQSNAASQQAIPSIESGDTPQDSSQPGEKSSAASS